MLLQRNPKEDAMKSQDVLPNKFEAPAVPLRLSEPADLQEKIQNIQLAIARRAHELFETRGRVHGRDLEDWLRAECELLCPISVWMSQSADRVFVRAKVTGFDHSDLEVSVEPKRVTILGKKKQNVAKTITGTTERGGSYPEQIVAVLDLAAEVLPERTIVKAQPGILKCELAGDPSVSSLT